ncbi:Atp23p [Dipodascopsis uninucleata]
MAAKENSNSDSRDSEDVSSSQSNVKVPKGFQWLRMMAAHYTGSLDASEEKQYKEFAEQRTKLTECERCEDYRNWNLRFSPTVLFLKDHITKLGGKVGPQNIFCDHCDEYKAGGFSPDHGILLCQNHTYNKLHLEDTLSHELIHAYDELKFHVDWMNLKHHACSEIRASNLSGECRFMNEFVRKLQLNFTRQHQICVRRRAILSVMGNPNCKDQEHAARVVDQVWDSCFNDTRPFDEIYR